MLSMHIMLLITLYMLSIISASAVKCCVSDIHGLCCIMTFAFRP